MAWEDELNELAARRELALQMGGPDKVARQHEFNKLTIRERIDAVADGKSFHEIGALAGVGSYDDDGNLIDRGTTEDGAVTLEPVWPSPSPGPGPAPGAATGNGVPPGPAGPTSPSMAGGSRWSVRSPTPVGTRSMPRANSSRPGSWMFTRTMTAR